MKSTLCTNGGKKPFQVPCKNNFQASDPTINRLAVRYYVGRASERERAKKDAMNGGFCINARESHEYHNSGVSCALMNRYSSRRFIKNSSRICCCFFCEWNARLMER